MQYLFLILFVLCTFSVNAEAQDCSGNMTAGEYLAAGCGPRVPQAQNQVEPAQAVPQQTGQQQTQPSQRKQPTNTGRSAQQQQQATNGSTCKRPINWRSSCLYGWDDANCRCKQTGDSSQDSKAGNTNSQSSTEDSAVAGQAVQQCQADLLQAQVDCDQEQDTGIQGAQTTLSNFAVQMGSQMGIQAACSGLGKALMGANGAVTAFSYMCSNSQSKCKTSCRNALNNINTLDSRYDQVDSNYRNCLALDAKIAQASQAIGNLVNGIQGAQSCAQQTGTDLYDYCKSNPSALGCSNVAQDCSNPTVAASNPICICKANPSSSTCVAMNLKAGDGFQESLNGGGSGSAIPNGGGSNVGGLDGLLNDVSWQGDPNLKPSSGPSEDAGGAKGGRPLMEGNSGGSGGGDGNGGGAGSGTAVAVNAGFRGGGGGGWFGGGSNGNGGYGGQPAGQVPAGKNGPDLRQFLPGGKFDPKNRGLAGISGPDGITGPHTDIWKKINNRYQIEKSKLMP